MTAFLYGVALQWRLDIRSKSLLITCYAVPLLFFAVMGGIFTSINPESKATLIQSMTIMGVSMGAMIGVPPSLTEIYGGNIKKVYRANGVPMYLGVVSVFLSAFIHLMIMSVIIYFIAPIAFNASFPTDPFKYFGALAVFTATSLSVGCLLGILVKNQSKLTMLSQVIFLPSIMLSGIMFPANMLPQILEISGRIFPASWGFILMSDNGLTWGSALPLIIIFAISVISCGALLKKLQSE